MNPHLIDDRRLSRFFHVLCFPGVFVVNAAPYLMFLKLYFFKVHILYSAKYAFYFLVII